MHRLRLSNQAQVTPEQEELARQHAQSMGLQMSQIIGLQPSGVGESEPAGVMWNAPNGSTYTAPMKKKETPIQAPGAGITTPTLSLSSLAARDKATGIPTLDDDKVQIGLTDFPNYSEKTIADAEDAMLRDRPEWTNRQFLPTGMQSIPVADVEGITSLQVTDWQNEREPKVRISPRTKQKKSSLSLKLAAEDDEEEVDTATPEVGDITDTSETNVIRQKSFPKKFPEPTGAIPLLSAEGKAIYMEMRNLSRTIAEVEAQVEELIAAAMVKANEFKGAKQYVTLISQKQAQLDELRRVVATYPDKLSHIEETVLGIWDAHRQRSQAPSPSAFKKALIAEFPALKKRIEELYQKVRGYKEVPEKLLIVDVSGEKKDWKGLHLSSYIPQRLKLSAIDLLDELLSLVNAIDASLDNIVEHSRDEVAIAA